LLSLQSTAVSTGSIRSLEGVSEPPTDSDQFRSVVSIEW
jgi:hypothetical protein